MDDLLFRGSLAELDPDINELAELEAERQYRKLILIPSESTSPIAVREALATAYNNLYAEGYPREDMRWMDESEALDFAARLTHFRRYSDRRYYKGVEYVNIVEILARRRCAELFATNGVRPDDLYVNVQPLSGAPANNAVYHACVKPGETIMGLNLLHGGHLTHGSPVNRSGKYYQVAHYEVDPETERINYDRIAEIARQVRPKLIIAGYSSYPWAVDWVRFKEIAEAVGGILLADIAHVAGMVVTGAYPSPVGIADVITFTTHKSLCGPRGACILTTDARLAREIDRAVFPGEQGGPHVNTIVAMAVAFKLAGSEQFRQLQHQVVKNCFVFTERLRERGLRIPYGGTDTHLMNLDCSTITGEDGTTLSGDMASRILDLAGIVVNRNTIPGDISVADPSGIRMGTPWITQRGFKEPETVQLADIIADVLFATKPHGRGGMAGKIRRAKVSFNMLEETKLRVRNLAESAGIDFQSTRHGYPHFYYLDDQPRKRDWAVLELSGDHVRQFLNYALTSDVESLGSGAEQPTSLIASGVEVKGKLTCLGSKRFHLAIPAAQSGLVTAWLRDLSDGFVEFDQDILRKLPGLTEVEEVDGEPGTIPPATTYAPNKPYYIGITGGGGEPLPEFNWQEQEVPLSRTPIYETHKRLGAKIIPFAGWEMPVWYSSVLEEHLAVRQSAGLFDVAHMGVYQVEGADAEAFLDSVVANDVSFLNVGESCYTHLLDPDASVIDDLLVYRRGKEKFMLVVNAANDDKDWAWLTAVKEGRVLVDRQRPWARAFGRHASLRNLKDPQEGPDRRVDIALQGPKSREILLALGCDDQNAWCVNSLKRTQLCEAKLGGFDLIVSRTGYTGEKFSFELFVHPDAADEFFNALLEAGKPFGIKPVGLGARDSLRTEAGLPLYGHEMGGEFNLGVAEAGFGAYVKTYKAWFIGREAFLRREKERRGEVVRFRFNEKGVRMAHPGDPVLDRRGRVIGMVTSCAVDEEGLLTGQAYLESRNIEKDMPIQIYQSASKEVVKPYGNLKPGERVTLPTPAKVIRRFPKLK